MQEDNSCDGEHKESPEPVSPKMGGKKCKMNDGSSQLSLQETDPNYQPNGGCTPEDTGKEFHLKVL